MILAGESGKLWHDGITLQVSNESLMGLEKRGDDLYVGAKSTITKLSPNEEITYKAREDTQFHKIKFIDNELYVTCTGLNEIWRFTPQLQLISQHPINPPKPGPIQKGKNYNHINSIAWNIDHFLVLLNWYEFQFGYSGICALDTNFKELFRYSYGWQAHALQIIDNELWMLCGSTKALGKTIYHPHKCGIMIDGEIVWEANPDIYFLKDMAITSDSVYVAGGHLKHRENRAWDTGIVFILDRNFQLQDKLEMEGSGGLCGILLD